MKNLIFAKLFMIGDDRQVLIQRLYDTEEEKDFVEISSRLDGWHAKVSLNMEEHDLDEYFEEFDQQKAEQFLEVMKAKMK